MVQLQTPKYAVRNGELIPWSDAVLHIGCEGVNRGLSVFEGIKGYWHSNGLFGLIEMRNHYERLQRSARMLHIPCPWSFEEFETWVHTLVNALIGEDRDMWVRATLIVVDGHWGEDTRADLILTAFHQDKAPPEPIRLGISTWQRSTDNSLPYRIKSAANYQVGRLARIEGRAQGCADMILLNHEGRVAEATGSAVLIVRDGVVITPTHCEGALESITVDCVETIARSMDVPFIRRPVDRTELSVATEVCICGTLAEMVPVENIAGFDVDAEGPVFGALRQRFYDIVHGRADSGDIELTFLPR